MTIMTHHDGFMMTAGFDRFIGCAHVTMTQSLQQETSALALELDGSFVICSNGGIYAISYGGQHVTPMPPCDSNDAVMSFVRAKPVMAATAATSQRQHPYCLLYVVLMQP